MIATSDLRGFDGLPEARRKLIERARAAGGEVAGMLYLYYAPRFSTPHTRTRSTSAPRVRSFSSMCS
jgi:hypothetical protein